MPADRFEFQRECVRAALDDDQGVCLNVGANDDNGNLKSLDPDRVINCDLFDHDQVLDRPNAADVLFDAARDRWPFDDGSACLVVLGDILEHLTPDEIEAALIEARRVGRTLCITVPEDHRDEVSDERADTYPRGAVHRTVVTEQLLRRALKATGWHVTSWRIVEYDDGRFWGQRTMGHFVTAE